MADFLVALADFDRRRVWEALGHASLFAFLHVELGLSTSSTFWRSSAARLLQAFPELVDPLRQGRLCLTTMAELAKVLTEVNKDVVLPRFLGISSREAKEIVAELQPREAPPIRAVVTSAAAAIARPQPALTIVLARSHGPLDLVADMLPGVTPGHTYSESFRAPEMNLTHPARDAARVEAPAAQPRVPPSAPPRDDVEPLTADLRRLHVTVSRRFLKKLDAARDGLSHAVPGATTERVLEVALDLLLEKQAKVRGLVKKPRTRLPASAPLVDAAPSPDAVQARSATPLELLLTEPSPHRRTGPREPIPAAVRRAVWARDGGRCSWPLDGGGACGSTHRLELDHVVPWARGGDTTVANLRVTCAAHNRLAARQAFGGRCVGRYSRAAGPRNGGCG